MKFSDMEVVHQLVLLYVIATLPVSSTEPAGSDYVTCHGQAAEPSVLAQSTSSKGTSLVQVKTMVKKTALTQPVSPMLQSIKRKVAKASKARPSLVKTKTSNRGRVVAEANVSSRSRFLVQANASSRGHSMVQSNASGSGPSMVQTNASGSVASMVHINAEGSREPRLQQRLATLVRQGTDLSNGFMDVFHRLARSQKAQTQASTGFWLCITLLSFMVISCFAAWMFISRRPHSPVPGPVFLRGIRQRAALSGKATPGGMRNIFSSSDATGQLASPGSHLDPEPMALATTGQLPSSRLLPGPGAESGSSVLSVMHPGAAATHDHSTLSGPKCIISIDPYFCQDLVVPPACECVLKVPLRCLSKGPFEACDPNDNAVLRVEPRPLHQAVGGAQGFLKLVLTTEFGTTVAQCMPSPARIAGQSPEREQRECVLLRASGETFAVIKMEVDDSERYTLTTKLDGRLHVWGNKQEQALNIVDSSGKLVAKTCRMTDNLDFIPSGAMAGQRPNVSMDPDKVYFTLGVAPLIDVGLILCVVLCIQHLM